MRLIFSAVFVLLMASSTWAVTPAVQAVRAVSAPVIDGRLDDPCWQNAVPATHFLVNNTTTPSKYDTRAMVMFDDAFLYIGVRCGEPDVTSIQTRQLPRDHGDVFRTDCIEIMIDPELSRNNYFHIGVNASASVADRACTQGGHIGDWSWDAKIEAATHVGGDFWSCELAIPLYSLGLTPRVGETWGINICREKKSPAEDSSLAEQGSFNIAARFAELRGMTVDVSRYCYVIGETTPQMVGRGGEVELVLQVPVENGTGDDGTALLECWVISPSGAVLTAGRLISLATNAAQTFNLGPMKLSESGAHEAYVRVADTDTKMPLSVRHVTAAIDYVPIQLRLVQPWYRDAIFATQNIKQVVVDLDVRLDPQALATTKGIVRIVKATDGAVLAEQALSSPQPVTRVTFDAVALPETTMRIEVMLSDGDGRPVAQTLRTLRKLPHRTGEVWLGQDGQWHVDGKPFFINGAWNYAEDFLPDYNVFTGEAPGALLLDVAIMNLLHYRAPSLKSEQLSEADAALVREYIRKARDNDNLLGYYTSDEPEVASVSARALAQVYDIIAEEDPYHPVIISNDSMHGLHAYARSGDINGLHPYPVILRQHRVNDVGTVAAYVSGAVETFRHREHRQTIAYLHQGFNYGDYGAVNNRIPTYVEYRNQNLLALICGANGFIQFNRMVAHYPELYIGMGHLTKEFAFLGPVILAPTSAIVPTASSDQIRMLLKEHEGDLYLLACNADMQPREVTFTLAGIGERGRSLNVICEGRTVPVTGDQFTDSFDTYEVHVYTTATTTPDLLTVAEISTLIDQANEQRRKPGNLAFQMFEGDGVILAASSHEGGKYRRPENGLWHVVDGVIDQIDRYKALTWQDTTPNEFPDWLEIRLPQAYAIGRVVVYPFEKSLRDYAVQALIDGEWREVGQAAGQEAERIEHRFDAVTTDRIRLWVTATNGPNSKVTEVEIYEQ